MLRPHLTLAAKAPIAGRAKTRLCPPLTPGEAADLHSALLMDMVDMLMSLGSSIDVELSTDVPTDAWPGLALTRSTQKEGDLGARLFHALKQGLSTGGLPPAHVTLGPTLDGGFVAIASRAVRQEMFPGVRWSSECALADVVRDVEADLLRLVDMPDLQQNTADWARRNRER